MSIVLQSSGGGQITINEPTTASNFTQTLPSASGTVMVSGNMPAFSAYASTIQTVTTSTWTKLTVDLEKFDTANCFASSRFTPNIAGYYQVNLIAYSYPSSLGVINVAVYKNGSSYSYAGSANSNQGPAISVGTLIYFNGTTDYIEAYLFQNSGSGLSSATTEFSASLVRTA